MFSRRSGRAPHAEIWEKYRKIDEKLEEEVEPPLSPEERSLVLEKRREKVWSPTGTFEDTPPRY